MPTKTIEADPYSFRDYILSNYPGMHIILGGKLFRNRRGQPIIETSLKKFYSVEGPIPVNNLKNLGLYLHALIIGLEAYLMHEPFKPETIKI